MARGGAVGKFSGANQNVQQRTRSAVGRHGQETHRHDGGDRVLVGTEGERTDQSGSGPAAGIGAAAEFAFAGAATDADLKGRGSTEEGVRRAGAGLATRGQPVVDRG